MTIHDEKLDTVPFSLDLQRIYWFLWWHLCERPRMWKQYRDFDKQFKNGEDDIPF